MELYSSTLQGNTAVMSSVVGSSSIALANSPLMLSLSLQRPSYLLHVLTFASTDFVQPVLEILLADVPGEFRAELRLGLQEALINAARHGNCSDPNKLVRVHFSMTPNRYLWIITDEGPGFNCHKQYRYDPTCEDNYVHKECGRGVMILKQIFDEVCWNPQGNQLRLSKHLYPGRCPVVT